MGILLEAQIENVTTRKDKTLKLTLGTQELSAKNMAELMSMNQQLIHAYINSSGITPDQIKVVDGAESELLESVGKSQSQRIRNTLFVLYNQNNEGFKTANDYYVSKTEKYLEHLKSKIL
jgi:hypothetical protein